MLELIQNEGKFYSMRDDWNRLLEKSGVDNPYLTHEWLSSWWKAYKDEKELIIVNFRDQGRIIGAIPLFLSKEMIFGVPIKVINFFADHWGSMDLILTEKKAECVAEFFSWFHSSKIADVLILSRIPEVSENASIIEQAVMNRKLNYKKTRLKNTVILLQGSWDDYLKQLTKKFRYEIKNKQKKLLGLGNVKYERITEVEDADKILPALRAVGVKSWKYKDKKGIAVSNQGWQFYRNIISEWGRAKKLDISILKQNDRPIAFAVRVKHKETCYALETAYDQDYYVYSPGLVVNSVLLERLFEENSVKKYELGQVNESKNRWSQNCSPELKFNIYNKTNKIRFLLQLKKIKDIISGKNKTKYKGL
ncbi:GNAT family N-acetyltransferase [Candidatus Omnitrophota bacterium]